MDDWKLLNEYAARNSEDAFRTLVDRYAALVYHVALRQLGNPQSAEEVTQGVFIALAQKAGKISRRTVLSGWLFRATRFAVLNLVRDENCRRSYEHEALTMQITSDSNEADSVWEQILPHLDDALDRLSQSDRELVLIRFFGSKSYKEVAQVLGITEDTAKKRLSRAIEKLRAFFTRRGVVVPSISLTIAFAAFGAQAAPSGLVSSVAAAALSKGTIGAASTLTLAKGILKLMVWAKAKTSIIFGAGTLLVAAGTLGVLAKATGTSADDLISKLEHQSGKRIVWDKHLSLPATLDLQNLYLEEALDRLAVQMGAYWTIDYVVYGSDKALRDLIALLREGSPLQFGGWTNLSSRPLRPAISFVGYSPRGLSGGSVRITKPGSGNNIGMVVMLGSEASAQLSHRAGAAMQHGTSGEDNQPPAGGPYATPYATIINAMKEGQAEGVLAPERLLAENRLVPKMEASTPVPANVTTAANLAKKASAHWAMIYTLRQSPLNGAGIKLVHTGAEMMNRNSSLPVTAATIQQRMQTNRFNLTPEDRAAHARAVQNLKKKQ
jgi:RNA polymerase sigma factor (sigma-70 family)